MAATHTLSTFRYEASSNTFIKKSVERALRPNEIKIQVTHSGVCYTDVHAKDKACGLGHEGVGVVATIGDNVTSMKLGDRVGWGVETESVSLAATALYVSTDIANIVLKQVALLSATMSKVIRQCAFADFHIIDADFAYHIPPEIPSWQAGVFMCAGASTYEALDAAGTKPHHRIGVVGLGGLGHMAVLFAKAMGCVVTVFSGSFGRAESKAEDAFKLGADELRTLSDIDTTLRPGRSEYLSAGGNETQSVSLVDVLLVCCNETPDLEKILPFLARRATIVLMSIQQKPLVVPYMPFILPGHKIVASTEASRQNHLAMIQFAARHKISPWVERFPMTEDGLKSAFERLENGEMRFRGVLEVPGA
ncbi:GroES-like protein [Aureobasidium subglaciale]|nr:GroES-like protein [Aureobasidium subglaciale]KAI5228214.1 GroES-like protein [Aureobasidium subglaciale]KAI5231400.1 GroES-like protein [Aureobasidium subglaciale]KAI5265585.1 GroES-like protein [Aureobasidium subglaciale]